MSQSVIGEKKPSVEVKYLTMMGDSLSDRGTLNKSYILGCIPMGAVSGLDRYSPDGRFTNGLVWSDHVAATIANEFSIQKFKRKKNLDNSDISDAIITQDKRVLKSISTSYSLDDDNSIRYNGRPWIRSYCAGGLMAHDYSWSWVSNIVLFFTRLIVSTLNKMYKQLVSYDEAHTVSAEQKQDTLIMEWSGANDLITVNSKPTKAIADKAIQARVENIKKLISFGYRNFMLFNLPNLAMTPRFKAKSDDEQRNADECSTYFNEQLVAACTQLAKDYPHCIVETYDINSLFQKIYNNPEKYFFDKNKLTIPYTTSPDFTKPVNNISQATGYMFYDDVHPTADLHALLASDLTKHLSSKFQLLEPDKECRNKRPPLSDEQLANCFRHHYEVQLKKDRNSFFRSSQSNIDYKNADLETILTHALKEDGPRSLQVLKQLGWLDKDKNPILKEEAFKETITTIEANHSRPVYAAG